MNDRWCCISKQDGNTDLQRIFSLFRRYSMIHRHFRTCIFRQRQTFFSRAWETKKCEKINNKNNEKNSWYRIYIIIKIFFYRHILKQLSYISYSMIHFTWIFRSSMWLHHLRTHFSGLFERDAEIILVIAILDSRSNVKQQDIK